MLYDDSVSDRGSHRPWKTTNLTEIRTETISLVVCLVLVYSYILDPDQHSVKVLGSYFNYSGETFFRNNFHIHQSERNKTVGNRKVRTFNTSQEEKEDSKDRPLKHEGQIVKCHIHFFLFSLTYYFHILISVPHCHSSKHIKLKLKIEQLV